MASSTCTADRITPAYAGKRPVLHGAGSWSRDHPRVCGEKQGLEQPLQMQAGSPPRMRGKEMQEQLAKLTDGITPAYAGKRCFGLRCGVLHWDHPRVCGEKWLIASLTQSLLGSPPRMRGKVAPFTFLFQLGGITPAYAGKRRKNRDRENADRDHPRVCGEKTKKIP